MWLTNIHGRRLGRVWDTAIAFIKNSVLSRLLQQESEEESFSKLGPLVLELEAIFVDAFGLVAADVARLEGESCL